jgi:hypothetical protein
MYKAANRFQQSQSRATGAMSEVRSNSEIMAERELERYIAGKPEYKILFTNLANIGLSAVKILRVIKNGARPTRVLLSVKEPLKSRDFKEFSDNIANACNNLKAAAGKLGARSEESGLLTKINSIYAELRELAEALGVAKV